MLNRRILRIKAFKAIYTYAENHGMTLKETEAVLDRSCESTRDLYLFLLSVIGPLTSEAGSRMEMARSKFNPTFEELHPNTRFVDNKLTAILTEDPDFSKLLHKKKLSWDQYDVFLRHLYESIRERKYFKDYLASEETGLEVDAKLWIRIFEHEFEDNPELADILEDLSIYWNDDIGYALRWCCRSVKELGAGLPWNLPDLYLGDAAEGRAPSSNQPFVVNLTRKAFLNFDDDCAKIAELTPKWNKDRLCITDLALIVCGMSEALTEPDTSIRIIINEYVEISKYYSTPESSAFVNGLLDKLINKHEQL